MVGMGIRNGHWGWDVNERSMALYIYGCSSGTRGSIKTLRSDSTSRSLSSRISFWGLFRSPFLYNISLNIYILKDMSLGNGQVLMKPLEP